MIRSCHDYDIAWQLIELHQQERDDTLDFACFMRIPALFADCVEFVEEKNARTRPYIVEQFAKSGVGFSEIATDQGIITN